jgi:hypothetical protein
LILIVKKEEPRVAYLAIYTRLALSHSLCESLGSFAFWVNYFLGFYVIYLLFILATLLLPKSIFFSFLSFLRLYYSLFIVVKVIEIFIVAYFYLYKQLFDFSLLVIIDKVFNTGGVLAKLVIRMLSFLKSVFSDLLLYIIKGLKKKRA